MNNLLINPHCPGCVALSNEVEALKQLVLTLQGQVTALEEEVAKARKNSSNSSKPPSSDIVKPQPQRKKRGKRKKGGQPGHVKYERTFNLEDADEQHTYTLSRCPSCSGAHLDLLDGAEKIDFQYELVDQPVILHAHQRSAYWCADCQQIHYARMPVEVHNGGLVGPRLSAMIGCLKGGCHTSYTTLQSFLGDVMDTPLSTGMLAKVVQKVSRALSPSYLELLNVLPDQNCLNIDETGHKENGQRMWNWVFRAPTFTLFTIEESRGAKVLKDVLGAECEAVLGSDYFSSYRAFMKDASVCVQFCLAHLIRTVRFIAQSKNRVIANYGNRVLEGIRQIFKLIHRRDKLLPDTFRKRLEKARDQFLKMATRTQAGGDAKTLAKRLRLHGREYFTFITNPDIDPTNNVAERALRFCVINRRITQGTRSLAGREWCERVWTTMATCAQQGRSAFRFITAAVQAQFSDTQSPSLMAPLKS
jgi:transposase